MAESKEDFYKALYHNPDSDDDDLDNFADFRNDHSHDVVLSQDPGKSEDNGSPKTPSQTPTTSSLQASNTIQLPDNLKKNYISSPDQFNKWLKLTKKELTRPKTAKLKGLVLFYWPAYTTLLPGKNRRRAYAAAIQHGGEIAIKWDDALRVTHIVVEPASKGREYKDVLQNLKLAEIPKNVQLVKSGWVDEMLQPKHAILVLSEDRFRLSGHPLPSATASGIAEEKTKKRSASMALLDTIASDKSKQQQFSPPGLKKHNTDGDRMNSATRASNVGTHNLLTSDSPKLMKQSLHANFGAQLGAKMRNRGLKFSVPDEIDRAIDQIQKSKAARQISNHSSHASDKLTADGENIDRLHKLTHEDKDDLDDIGEESEEDGEDVLDSKVKNFLCAKKSLKGDTESGPNAALIEQLKLLAAYYDNKKDDMFRAKGYREAISVIRKQKHQIATKQQALDLRRIGQSIATKIEDFHKHGEICLVETFASDPREQIIKLFTGVYGAGQKTAEEWYNKGHRTLDDLQGINLHDHQRTGLDHYEDFNTRISRSEVTSHVEYVTEAARKISEHLEVVVGGSYRREQADSGDIDFLVTASDSIVSNTQLHKLVFEQLIPVLHDTGYVKADLTSRPEDRELSKWLGAACLPGMSPEVWRRVDILLVPNAEWGAALIYFTGNDIFNRSLRLLARRSGGKLNQHGLYKGIIRNKDGTKAVPGILIEGRDERKIFEALGVKWRPPHERCP